MPLIRKLKETEVACVAAGWPVEHRRRLQLAPSGGSIAASAGDAQAKKNPSINRWGEGSAKGSRLSVTRETAEDNTEL